MINLQDKSSYLGKQRFHYDFLGKCQNISEWQKVIDNYDYWSKRDTTIDVIPKKIHQIWVGSKLPKKYEKYCKSWQLKMPDYQYILWDEQRIKTIKSPLQSFFQKANNPGTKSDLARYMILNKHGGLYVDTDFECIRHIGPCLSGSTFICGQEPANPTGTVCYLNGLIAATPRHKIIKDVISEILALDALDETETSAIIENTGPLLLTRCITSNYNNSSVGCLPSNYFYPWPAFMKDVSVDATKYFVECTYAVHHWECSWFKWIDYEKLTRLKKIRFKAKQYLSRITG